MWPSLFCILLKLGWARSSISSNPSRLPSLAVDQHRITFMLFWDLLLLRCRCTRFVIYVSLSLDMCLTRLHQVRTGYRTEWPLTTGRGSVGNAANIVWYIWVVVSTQFNTTRHNILTRNPPPFSLFLFRFSQFFISQAFSCSADSSSKNGQENQPTTMSLKLTELVCDIVLVDIVMNQRVLDTNFLLSLNGYNTSSTP